MKSFSGKKESKKWRTITKLTPKDFLKAVETNASQISEFNDIELSNAFDQLPEEELGCNSMIKNIEGELLRQTPEKFRTKSPISYP